MKVGSGKPITELNGSLKNNGSKVGEKKAGVKGAGEPGKTDSVQISTESRKAARLREVLDSHPDIREEKVTALKKEVDEGTYKVDSNKVADKVIREALVESALKGE